VYSGGIQEYHLGDIRLQRFYRRMFASDTNSHVVEVELEDVQEDCRNVSTWRWRAGHCVRDTQECVSHSCEPL
jgi:hypothetical protein